MYGALYGYLDDQGITASDIDRMQRAVIADDRLGDRIFRHIWEQVENLARLSLSKSGFCCGVEAQALMKRDQSSSELAVKKLASISTTSFIHCGSINRYSGDVHEGYYLSWADFGTFLQLAFRYRPLVEGNLIIPTAEYSFTENIGDFGPELVTHADLRKDALKIDLDISEIEQQFFETSDGNFQTPVGSIEILLPHLRNVEIETIVRLRAKSKMHLFDTIDISQAFFVNHLNSTTSKALLNVFNESIKELGIQKQHLKV